MLQWRDGKWVYIEDGQMKVLGNVTHNSKLRICRRGDKVIINFEPIIIPATVFIDGWGEKIDGKLLSEVLEDGVDCNFALSPI